MPFSWCPFVFVVYEVIYFGVSCLVLALCILHGLSVSLVPAFSSSINSFTSSLLPLLLPPLSCFVWSVPKLCCLFCLPSEWTEPAWLPCILSACLSHSTVLLLPKPSPSTFGFLSTLVFPALTCNMSVKLSSIYSSLDVMNNKEQYMERCIYGWAEGPMS